MAHDSELIHESSLDSLRADCANCFGLCCVALPFAASADFSYTKEAGTPCHHLEGNFQCRIHAELRGNGFKGCTVFDCFGAGQKVSRVMFNGRDWRNESETARQMFAALPIVQQLQEMLWYITEALMRKEVTVVHRELMAIREETERLTYLDFASLSSLDIASHRSRVNNLLVQASELVRDKFSGGRSQKKNIKKGSDLIGARLKRADLSGANLRGVLLLAADLRWADLRGADLIGADLRDADLSGAKLTDVIFLTQVQVNAAKGDKHTKLPSFLYRPSHWKDFQI